MHPKQTLWAERGSPEGRTGVGRRTSQSCRREQVCCRPQTAGLDSRRGTAPRGGGRRRASSMRWPYRRVADATGGALSPSRGVPTSGEDAKDSRGYPASGVSGDITRPGLAGCWIRYVSAVINGGLRLTRVSHAAGRALINGPLAFRQSRQTSCWRGMPSIPRSTSPDGDGVVELVENIRLGAAVPPLGEPGSGGL